MTTDEQQKKKIAELEQETARLSGALKTSQDREATWFGLFCGAAIAVPMAFVFGRAFGLAARPTLRERFGSWLVDEGFKVLSKGEA